MKVNADKYNLIVPNHKDVSVTERKECIDAADSVTLLGKYTIFTLLFL